MDTKLLLDITVMNLIKLLVNYNKFKISNYYIVQMTSRITLHNHIINIGINIRTEADGKIIKIESFEYFEFIKSYNDELSSFISSSHINFNMDDFIKYLTYKLRDDDKIEIFYLYRT